MINNGDINIEIIEKSSKVIPYSINRNVIRQDELEKVTGYDRQKETILSSLKSSLTSLNIASLIFSTFPILHWLPKYQIKNYLINDLIAGFTVAVLTIPQGMAYGLLAGLDPVVGLYMAFFPTLIYVIFGTSKHVSVGTFAIVSIMTSKVVATYTDPHYGDPELMREEDSYSNYQVATAATLACGIFHLIMYIFRLGIVTSLLSEALVSGFTTAAAIHVVIAQSRELLGVSFPRHNGIFKAILSTKDILLQIPHANLTTIYVSIACVAFMITMNEIVKPAVAKKCKFPIPSELIAVVGFTFCSYFLQLGGKFHVEEVGVVPTGLPIPIFPPLKLVLMVSVDSIAICIVSYSIIVSMGLICAKKDKYEVRPNQELLALGLGNIVGSCFSCIPLACALSRTIVQYQTGGKTQIASVVSALLILILLLWLGPLFETLPRAVLAGIIIVALKGMLWQFKDVKKYYRESKLDAIVWLATFCTVVIIDIDIGLLVGALLSLLTLYMKGFKSHSCMLGQINGTEIYVDFKVHKNAAEIQNVKIFRYFGSINFATCASFKKDLCEKIKVDCKVIKAASKCTQVEARELSNGMRILIIDMCAVLHLDVRGYRTLIEIKNELKMLDVRVFLVDVNDVVYDAVKRAVKLGENEFEIFPTIHDCILYVK